MKFGYIKGSTTLPPPNIIPVHRKHSAPPALGFKARLLSLQGGNCSLCKHQCICSWGSRGKSSLGSPSSIIRSFFCLLWRKLLIFKEVESSSLDLIETQSRIVVAGQRKWGQQKLNYLFAAELKPMQTHSPGCSFGTLLLLPAGKCIISLGNFSIQKECKHKAPFTSNFQHLG